MKHSEQVSYSYVHAGAILEDVPVDDEVSSLKFAGSTIVVVAESKQEVIDLLKKDVYVESGVWDLEKVSAREKSFLWLERPRFTSS